MDLLIDARDLTHAPTQIGSMPPESESPEFAPVSGPTEKYLAHHQSTLVNDWLHEMKSTSRRSRRKMRATNPLFPDNPHDQSK